MTNGASAVANLSLSYDTSAAATSTSTQTPILPMENSTVSLPNTNSIMFGAISVPSSLSAAPDNPQQSVKYDHRKIEPENESKGQLASSLKSASDSSPIPALSISEAGEMRWSSKRSRSGENEEEDASPTPKRLATENRVQTEADGSAALIKQNLLSENATDAHEHDDNAVAEPEKSKTLSRKPTQKPASEKTNTKSSRGRACADCKRRKVKCKHRSGNDAEGETNSSQEPSSTKLSNAQGAASQPLDAEDGIESVTATAPPPNKIASKMEVEDGTGALLESEPLRKTKTKEKAAPKKARAPPERASTRTRKAPERFEDLLEQPTPTARSTKKGSSKVFDPVYITTNSTSRLGKADMYHMLVDDDTAWTSLSAEQQATLISMLPDIVENQRLLIKIRTGETENTRPQYLKASDIFRTEVAKFQADLTNGHLAKTWQAAAEQAVSERAEGEYDAWKAEEAELWWGQKSK